MREDAYSWLSQLSWDKILAAAIGLSFIALMRFLVEYVRIHRDKLNRVDFHVTQAVRSWVSTVGADKGEDTTTRALMNRKQLIVSLIAATWISVVALTEPSMYWPQRTTDVFLKSLPALVFGVVLYRWFGRAPK